MRLHPASGFGLAAGASALLFLPELPNALWPLLAGLILAAIALRTARSGLLAFLVPAAFGFAYAAFVAHGVYADRLPPDLEGEEIEISGRVASLPIRDARSLRFDLHLGDQNAPLPERIRLPRRWCASATRWRTPRRRWR